MSSADPFSRIRERLFRLPAEEQELLPILDFLEAFPEHATEASFVQLVGTMALALAGCTQGGIWDGRRWIFLQGDAPAYPFHPGSGWISLPWQEATAIHGHLVLRSETLPPALPLLLSISAPLLAWRRLEGVRSDQNQALSQQVSRLNTLFELTRTLGESERKEDILALAARKIMSEFLIPKLLVVGTDGAVVFSSGIGPLPPILEGESLHDLAAVEGLVHAIEIRDQDQDHGFAYACQPLAAPISDEDERFLQTLVALTSARLSRIGLREARLQKQRIEKDLELARDIQRRILPKRLPEPSGWSCAAAALPYERVGGDLYDLWMASDQETELRLHFAVADVSGKGLPAALMMTQLSAFLRAMADRRVEDWGHLARRLNRRMDEVRERHRYATLTAGSINPLDGTVRYVNAGHNPPLLIPGGHGDIKRLEPTGPVVGLLPQARFEEGRACMQPGDTLLVFTDGLVDAESPRGSELGDAPLIEVVRQSPHDATAEDLLEGLLTRTLNHLEDGGFTDDVTLMVIKRLPGVIPTPEGSILVKEELHP